MKAFKSVLFLLLVFISSINMAVSQWIKVEGGVVWCYAFDSKYIYAGHAGGIYIPGDTTAPRNVVRSSDSGAIWENVSNGLTSGSVYSLQVRSLAIKGNNIFAGTDNGIFISTNQGDNWTQTSYDPSNGEVECFLIEDSVIFAGVDAGFDGACDGFGGVFRSNDEGETWQPANSGLQNNCQDKRINTFAKIGSTLFAGSYGGGIFISTDNGDNWTHNYNSSNWRVMSFAVIDTALFAGLEGDIFRSTNFGTTWIRTDSGLINSPNDDFFTTSFAVYSKNIFAGALFKGVFLSTDMGNSWISVNDNLGIEIGSCDIFSLAVIGNYIFAGTGATGIYRRPLTEIITSVHENSADVPIEYILEQNYPNPFNPSTVISYKLTVKSDVRLRIYDILGREIALLVNEVKNAGNHTVEWDGNNSAGEPVGSGIYFYRLTAGKYSNFKKMVLIR